MSSSLRVDDAEKSGKMNTNLSSGFEVGAFVSKADSPSRPSEELVVSKVPKPNPFSKYVYAPQHVKGLENKKAVSQDQVSPNAQPIRPSVAPVVLKPQPLPEYAYQASVVPPGPRVWNHRGRNQRAARGSVGASCSRVGKKQMATTSKAKQRKLVKDWDMIAVEESFGIEASYFKDMQRMPRKRGCSKGKTW